MQCGANFIVAPAIHEETAKTCNRRKILWIPGCGSVTEISKAEELGAEIVKIFPGKEVGGPGFVKAVKGPMPWSTLMPTGGVSPDKENLKAWFDAGVACVGIGSQLITDTIIRSGDLSQLKSKVSEVLEYIKELKTKSKK